MLRHIMAQRSRWRTYPARNKAGPRIEVEIKDLENGHDYVTPRAACAQTMTTSVKLEILNLRNPACERATLAVARSPSPVRCR